MEDTVFRKNQRDPFLSRTEGLRCPFGCPWGWRGGGSAGPVCLFCWWGTSRSSTSRRCSWKESRTSPVLPCWRSLELEDSKTGTEDKLSLAGTATNIFFIFVATDKSLLAATVSLAGAATSIIFVATKVLSRQTRVCRDKTRHSCFRFFQRAVSRSEWYHILL